MEDGLVVGNPLPAQRRRNSTGDCTHLPATLTKDGVGAILRAADEADVGKGVRRAHLIAAFTAQRAGEIVGATWDEVDLHSGAWSIPRERMTRKDAERGPHVVPIPPRPLTQMKEWRRADGPDAVYVCPASREGAPITREAVKNSTVGVYPYRESTRRIPGGPCFRLGPTTLVKMRMPQRRSQITQRVAKSTPRTTWPIDCNVVPI